MRLLIGVYTLFALVLPGMVGIGLIGKVLLSFPWAGSPTEVLDPQTAEVVGISLFFSLFPAFAALGLWRRWSAVRLILLVLSWLWMLSGLFLTLAAVLALPAGERSECVRLLLVGVIGTAFGFWQYRVLARPAVREEFEGRRRSTRSIPPPSVESPHSPSMGIVERISPGTPAAITKEPVSQPDLEVRPPAPFPSLVYVAGVIWIGFGCLALIVALINLALLGATVSGGPADPCPGFCCCFATLFGIAFIEGGFRSVKGTAEDTLGIAICSLLFGLLQVGFVALFVLAALLAGSPTPINQGPASPEFIASGISSAVGLGLIAAGVLALAGRQDYLAWRRWRKEQDVAP